MVDSKFVKEYLNTRSLKGNEAQRFVMEHVIPNMNEKQEMEVEKFPRYLKNTGKEIELIEDLGFKVTEIKSSLGEKYNYFVISCPETQE